MGSLAILVDYALTQKIKKRIVKKRI